MPKPNEIIDMAASLMNDTAQEVYTDAACLPYFNMAMKELEELFQLNNMPVTNETSTVLDVPDGTTKIAFIGTLPQLPPDLIEIREMWESDDATNQWVPVTKKEFIPHYLETSPISAFGIWAWVRSEIRLPPCTLVKNLKLDYIRRLFLHPLVIEQINIDIPVEGIFMFAGYRTGALCAQFIGENKERADELNGFAVLALDRVLGINVKGKQSIQVRRRPFMASYRARRR